MKQWYVVQVYTGYEDTVKEDLERRVVAEGAQDLFGEILIPMGEVSRGGLQEEAKKEKILPGYVLVEMEMVPEAFQLVTSVPRVAKFLGGADPMPLSEREIEQIRGQMTGKLIVTREEIAFVDGSEVTIVSGPFAGFIGIVEQVDEEREKITVMVSIFGRLTPVELGFDQVKR